MKREEFIKLGLTGGFLGGIGLSFVGLKNLITNDGNQGNETLFNVKKLTTNFHVRHGLYTAPNPDVVFSSSVSDVRKDVFAQGGVVANDKLDMLNFSFNLKGERYSLHLLEEKLFFKGVGVSSIQELDVNSNEIIELLVNDRVECHLCNNTSEVKVQKSGDYVLIPITNDIVVNDVSIGQDAFISASLYRGNNLQIEGKNTKVLLIKTS